MPNYSPAIRGKLRTKGPKGDVIVEAAVGLCVIVPIFLLMLDLSCLVIGQSINDDLAKSCARAAAKCSTSSAGETAATTYVANSQYAGTTGMVGGAQVSQFTWNTTTNQVTVVTQVNVVLLVPVPFGGPSFEVMSAQTSEPILGLPPSLAASSS